MGEGLQRAVKAARATRAPNKGKLLATAGHNVRRSTQSEKLAGMGWLRVSKAAEKIGKGFGYIHQQMRRPDSPLHQSQGGSMRVGYLHFISEAGLRKLVGDAYADACKLRRPEQMVTFKAAP
jgi:hypothetical protein